MSRPAAQWAERIYGVLVALYPRDFRTRYGPAMRLALRDLLEDPEMPAWRIWFSVLRDLRGSFLHEHLANLTGGISMTRDRLLPGALVRHGIAEIRTHRTGIVAGLARVAVLTVLIATPVATGVVGYYVGRSQVSPVAVPGPLPPEGSTNTFWQNSPVDVSALQRLIKDRAGEKQPVGASGYLYTKTDRMSLNLHFDATRGDPLAALVSKTSSEWIAADGSGRLRETTGEPIYLNERSRSGWDPAILRGILHEFNLDFGPRQLRFDDLSGLPTDPAVLAGVIRERAERGFYRGSFQVFTQLWVPPYGSIATDVSLPHAMFFTIGNMLRQQSAPPAVRAALYRVAAGIPGVELLGRVHDRAGRPGVAVAMTSAYTGLKQRHVLILDERTSALLADEDVLLEAPKWMDAKPPLVVGYTTYLEAGIVERLPIE
jgi:hypothetical protein